MNQVDAALSRLRDHPVDPRLADIGQAVLAEVDFQRRHGLPLSGSVFGLAAGLALTVGLLGTALQSGEGRSSPLAPFGAPPALAPSTLLGTGE